MNILDNHSALNRAKSREGIRKGGNNSVSVYIQYSHLSKRISAWINDGNIVEARDLLTGLDRHDVIGIIEARIIKLSAIKINKVNDIVEKYGYLAGIKCILGRKRDS